MQFAGAGFALQTSWQTVHNRVVLSNANLNTSRVLVDNNRIALDAGAVFSAGIAPEARPVSLRAGAALHALGKSGPQPPAQPDGGLVLDSFLDQPATGKLDAQPRLGEGPVAFDRAR